MNFLECRFFTPTQSFKYQTYVVLVNFFIAHLLSYLSGNTQSMGVRNQPPLKPGCLNRCDASCLFSTNCYFSVALPQWTSSEDRIGSSLWYVYKTKFNICERSGIWGCCFTKNLGIVHTDYKPFYELGRKIIYFVVAEERIHTVCSLLI